MKGYHSMLVSFLVSNKRINNKIALLWTPNDDTITSRIIHFNLNVYLFNVCVCLSVYVQQAYAVPTEGA